MIFKANFISLNVEFDELFCLPTGSLLLFDVSKSHVQFSACICSFALENYLVHWTENLINQLYSRNINAFSLIYFKQRFKIWNNTEGFILTDHGSALCYLWFKSHDPSSSEVSNKLTVLNRMYTLRHRLCLKTRRRLNCLPPGKH